ncbi:MAG: leucine-rich repeat domain-containing protein [Erysipelotrichaceae bacterium]|nr:leucine-rich repeat domain-containing protein [Erysipelotrichaceae bacterium]
MKKLLKIVLTIFMAMALAIQLPVNLVSLVSAEDEETNDFELVCTQTTLYLGSSPDFGYVYINTEIDDYDEDYVLSKEGIITQPEYLDDALRFEAISEGTVTITAIVTVDDEVVFEDSVEITVVNYLDVIADNSIEDPNNSDCYFVYDVLSEEDKTIEITEYYNSEEDSCPVTIKIPSTINGYTVVSIGEGSFIGYGDAWTITIPDTVTNIGYWAFIDCYSSTTITVPASVTSMADEVFGCPMLNVYSNSYALQYAIDKNIDYTIIDDDSDNNDAEKTEKTFYIDCNGIHASASYSLSELLTADELNSDSYIEFILSVADANDTVTDEEMAIIESKLGEYIGIQYLDIDLTKNVDGVLSDITSTSGKISVIVDIPDTLIETVGDTSGKYVVVRLHDGVVEILEDLDNDDDKVTFATDKFSTYAIAFVETTVTTSSTDDTTTTTNSESTTSTVSNVQTSDESQLVAYTLLGGIALLGIYCTRKKKYN